MVGIYDLSGRRVRQLSSAEVQNGRISLQWDGLDDGGAVVPPGIYVVEVEIRSDRKTEQRFSSVSVVY